MPEHANSDSLLRVGRIWRAHGVRGEVKVIPETDEPARFSDFEDVYVGTTPDSALPRKVESARLQRTKRGINIILKLQGFDSREDVDALRAFYVFAREEDLPALADDEVFVHDLIGLQVLTDTGDFIGIVEDVLTAPAQEIFIVRRPDNEIVMIPSVDEFVEDVDLAKQQIVIRPIEGLLE